MKIKNIRLFTLAAALLLAVAACDKPFEFDRPMSVSSRLVNLKQAAGSTHVMVYSNGAWTARLTEPVKWASLSKTSGEGINDVVFSYSANYAVARQVGIIFESQNVADTVMMVQAGAITEASFLLDYTSVNYLKAKATVTVPLSTNLRYGIESISSSVKYAEELDEDIDPASIEKWISNVKITRKGVTFDIAENTLEEPRIAYVNFVVNDPKATTPVTAALIVTQTAFDPAFRLAETSGTVDGAAAEIVVPAYENNIWPYNSTIDYEVDVDWISGVKLTSEGLVFKVSVNDGEEVRTGNIALSYSDADGNQVGATYTVNQKVFPREISAADVRALAPGEISVVNYLEGYIISDYTSPNIIESEQTKQFYFDRSIQKRTAYLQSVDGKYGFRLTFATETDAEIARYTKVWIALKGLTLSKESNPDRYQISGITAENIIFSEAGDASKLAPKYKTIAELTDDDIYTLVNVKDVEIMCKDGAYTNATDGYSLKETANPFSGSASAPRWDVSPLLCTDKDGSVIYMLTNANCTWRRGGADDTSAACKNTWDRKWGSLVPQGSGTFVGIVVAEQQVTNRYGDCGRYQLRYMAPEDIQLNGSKFSTTLVEWNWNNYTADTVPEVGSGSLNIYSATAAAASDFNNTYNGRNQDGGNGGTTSNQKGLCANAALKLTNSWWDFTNDEGRYFDLSFSTSGIIGSNMVFGIVWNHGAMGNTTLNSPAHWKLRYSVDGGATFNDVPDCEIIKNRSIVWWTTTSQDSCPGFKDHLRKLPNECFNKENVVIRVQVADKVTDINPNPSAVSDDSYKNFLGIEKGTLTDVATEIRIGTITVRYN